MNKQINQNSCILLVVIYSYASDARIHEHQNSVRWLKIEQTNVLGTLCDSRALESLIAFSSCENFDYVFI